MIRKELTYTDLFGKEVTRELYFHFSMAELVEMEAVEGETLSSRLIKVGTNATGAQIMSIFKELIQQAYGVRTEDGEFEKDPAAAAKFINSQAFDELLTELMMNPGMGAEFINGLFPANLQQKAEEIAKANGENLPDIVAKLQAEGRTIQDAEIKELVLAPFTDDQSGLEHPRGLDGQLLPWAFRQPSQKEQMVMDKDQLVDVMKRISKGWKPPEQAKPV
jgi:hypothetical protein